MWFSLSGIYTVTRSSKRRKNSLPELVEQVLELDKEPVPKMSVESSTSSENERSLMTQKANIFPFF